MRPVHGEGSALKIGRGTWIDKLASELVAREKELGRSLDMLRTESGLGASGIPHVGSLGDAVRSFGVSLALSDMGYASELIAYSDDMDGLRKVPEGMPDWLSDHLAMPVSSVPDPDGCYGSYGERMSSLLLEGLDGLGVAYEHRRASEVYASGALDEQAHVILSRHAEIGAKISEMTGQSKYSQRPPYHPVCSSCGRLYTAAPKSYDQESRSVGYSCSDASIGGRTVRGCGHRGVSRLGSDRGKLAWKVEFAARWAALDVRFEAYGKDIMDSVRVNDWVCSHILGRAPPHHARYEMFLDRGGRKISKSSGSAVTAQAWFRYGTPQSLLLLLYKRMSGARALSLQDIPSLESEYDSLEDLYFGRSQEPNAERSDRLRGLYEYVHLLRPPGEPRPRVAYAALAELCAMFREDRAERVSVRLEAMGVDTRHPAIAGMIERAGNFADDGLGGQVRPAASSAMTAPVREALAGVADGLDGGGDIHDLVRAAAGRGGVGARELFSAMYQILLGQPRGPRLGPLVSEMGSARVAAAIREAL